MGSLRNRPRATTGTGVVSAESALSPFRSKKKVRFPVLTVTGPPAEYPSNPLFASSKFPPLGAFGDRDGSRHEHAVSALAAQRNHLRSKRGIHETAADENSLPDFERRVIE